VKIAIITPYYKPPVDHLLRCIKSVQNQQTTHEIQHYVVADGYPIDQVDQYISSQQTKLIHFKLPFNHNDHGCTPCVIGSYSAIARGCEAICFLGEDNVMAPNHIQLCADVYERTKLPVIVTQRWFMTPDGETMDIPEEPNHVDGNCLFLTGESLRYIHMLAMMPRELSEINDRVFWDILKTRFKYEIIQEKTIGYATKWATHYRYAGLPVPLDAKENAGSVANEWIVSAPQEIKASWHKYLFGGTG
jgi:hypothetical protein